MRDTLYIKQKTRDQWKDIGHFTMYNSLKPDAVLLSYYSNDSKEYKALRQLAKEMLGDRRDSESLRIDGRSFIVQKQRS